MDTEVKEALLLEVTEIRNILFSAQSSFKIVDYLYRTREGVELEVINRSQFLKYEAMIHWRTYVTEMSKLFKPGTNDHFNIRQFIKKFKNGGCFQTPLIPDASIRIWEYDISSKKKGAKLDNLFEQRNKLYSHTDRDRADIKNTLTFIDAKELLNTVKRILSEIYIVIFEKSMIMEPINEPVDDLRKLMKVLAQEKAVWIKAEETIESEEFEKASAEFIVDNDNKAKLYGD